MEFYSLTSLRVGWKFSIIEQISVFFLTNEQKRNEKVLIFFTTNLRSFRQCLEWCVERTPCYLILLFDMCFPIFRVLRLVTTEISNKQQKKGCNFIVEIRLRNLFHINTNNYFLISNTYLRGSRWSSILDHHI